ncbi:MAG: HlyC/CorC family transporter [Planctomycetes bacterium]|nr:HlyC/CorC family transporter [Planctomycetota bacterium]
MFEALVILILVLCNGILAGSELAVVSARKARLQQWAEEGRRGARAALALRQNPERFLATVQVGINAIGAVAAAFGGATLAVRLEPFFEALGAGNAAPELAIAAIVLLITWLQVVFGELVPKSLALRVAEPFAVLVARPLGWLAFVGRPVVWLFATSSNLVLKLFHDKTSFLEGRITREDLELMVAEAHSGGSVDVATTGLMQRALEFAELRVDDVMVHRRSVTALRRDAGAADLRRALIEIGHRRVPVTDQGIDQVVGYVLRDDVMAALWDDKPLVVEALMRPPLFLPEVMPASKALREMQQRKVHLAIVVDESGGTAGIVTLEDLVEELVGEIFHERDERPPEAARQDRDGSWIVQGNADLRELAERLAIRLPESEQSRTLSGLLVELAAGHLPRQGQQFTLPDGTWIEAIEVSPRRVRSARIRVPTKSQTAASA